MKSIQEPLKNWIDKISAEGSLPANCKAILIGIYEGANGFYNIYFSASVVFSKENDDWACLTEDDYAPKNRYFYTDIPTTEDWESFQNMLVAEVKKIVDSGDTVLNQVKNIAIGFDDGDLVYL